MKQLVKILSVMALISSSANALASNVGSCSLIYPGQSDANNRSCTNPRAYGVAYMGYFMNERPCFTNVDDALNHMNASSACWEQSYVGNCAILFPGGSDFSGSSCLNEGAFGVTFNGYFISDRPCFGNVEDALATMRSTNACY